MSAEDDTVLDRPFRGKIRIVSDGTPAGTRTTVLDGSGGEVDLPGVVKIEVVAGAHLTRAWLEVYGAELDVVAHVGDGGESVEREPPVKVPLVGPAKGGASRC